jgi:hypothetical protein
MPPPTTTAPTSYNYGTYNYGTYELCDAYSLL